MLFDKKYIGVDIGGSSIKLGLFNIEGLLLAATTQPTPQPPMPGAVTIAICEAIEFLDPTNQAEFVGISVPGPIDSFGRIARISINLPGWIDVPLADWLEPRLKRKVILGNDGNCALIGEAWQGAAVGYQDVILLTLGTGVGGGVMIGGQIFTGRNGAASEPGLISIDLNGFECNSGNSGSLEQFGSLKGLKRLSDCEPIELNYRASIGRVDAIKVWEKYGQQLGVGISSLIYLFTPQLVVLGGGLSSSASYFLPSIRKEVNRRVQYLSREGLLIRAASLGNGAGRLGAAKLAIKCLTNNLIDAYEA